MSMVDLSSMAFFSRPRRDDVEQSAATLSGGARNAETTILRALSDAGQVAVAQAIGISETKLSRWKNSAPDGGGLHMQEVAAALDAMGLSVIDARPSDLITISRSEYDALRTLAAKGIAA
jgi:hypothetical protein